MYVCSVVRRGRARTCTCSSSRFIVAPLIPCGLTRAGDARRLSTTVVYRRGTGDDSDEDQSVVDSDSHLPARASLPSKGPSSTGPGVQQGLGLGADITLESSMPPVVIGSRGCPHPLSLPSCARALSLYLSRSLVLSFSRSIECRHGVNER